MVGVLFVPFGFLVFGKHNTLLLLMVLCGIVG